MKLHRLTIAVLVVMTVAGGAALAQEPKPAPEQVVPRPPSRPTLAVPLEVQIVISRYQGEKKVSSLPYTLAVNANSGDGTQLNIGGDVPIPMTTFTPVGDGKPNPMVSYSYKNIGTSINCRATSVDDGRFDLRVEIDESSVYTSGDGAKAGESPSFRSFRTRNTLLLRDGQTRQYTAATDRVSGETIRIEVTLRLVK
ncbi:MAG TPA: hypothetical protein VFO67_07670 [Gemmatimonadales bacterium]|nr:hypothetical protein [Gemmatimonadales bacterium]